MFAAAGTVFDTIQQIVLYSHINNPHSPREVASEKTTSKSLSSPQTDVIASEIKSLLTGDTIEDGVNKKIIEEALACVENPPEDVEMIIEHLIGIGIVLSEYGEIADQPPAINAIQHVLYVLVSQQYIQLIETELASDVPDVPKLLKMAAMVSNRYTGVLVKYYGDSELDGRLKDLQKKLEDM